jgi:lipopolysaccharide transport system ATP-binding protein
VLFVSHDTSSVKSLCSHAIWLEKGQILEQGTPKEVADLYLQAFYEAQQGKSTKTTIRPEYAKRDTRPKKDQRLQFINQTNLRNDIQLFDFNPEAASFGKGGATITNVTLTDSHGHPLAWIVGGEDVRLCVTAAANVDLLSPIIGFYVKDKLGQNLFGDNTYITTMDSPVRTEHGQELIAEFCFSMPLLAKGDYSICVAIAEGTQEVHEQQHWVHDALMFRSESTSVASGLIGLPMHSITFDHHALQERVL